MVRKLLVRAASLAWTAALLAGCGGGGSSSTPKSAPATVTSQSNATGTLTIKYPAGFAHVRNGLAAKRHAAYVNPTSGNVLHVSVDGTEISGSPFAVAATSDSTQLINSIPLYSGNTNVITVVEDDNNANELAYGQSPANPIAAGSTNPISLVLLMNSTRIGLTTDPAAGSDALLIDTSVGIATPFCLSGSSPIYPFAADPSAGYVLPGTPAGNGGLPAMNLINFTGPGTSRVGPEPLGYYVNFDGGNDPVTATFNEYNPEAGNVYGTALLFQSANCAQPNVVTLPTSITPPSGYKTATVPFFQPTMPVVAYGGYTYWAFDDIGNSTDFFIGKYDSQYNLISITAFPGDRYIWQITIDQLAQTVTFLGQNSQCCAGPGVTVAWSALAGL